MSKPQRKNISKKVRFEVFKRDLFQCQYCGRKAPDVVLQVDHITPVVEGGSNNILNLTTSCFECNIGKGSRKLTDNSVVKKQRQQLEELQERKEQIEMMVKWQRSLLELDTILIQNVADYWNELVQPYSLNKNGLRGLKKLLDRFETDLVLQSIKKSVEQYLKYDNNGKPIQDYVEQAWNYVGRICTVESNTKKFPYLQDLYYIRGILKNRLSYVDEIKALELLKECAICGKDLEKLKEHAKVVNNWSQWRDEILESIGN